VYLHTFGCKTNQYDTELVRQALESAGATMVLDPGAADAAVVNTCTVTHVSEAKMRGLVRRLAREHRGVRTVVMGCAAERDDGRLARLPGVVGVVGGADAVRVLEVLDLPTGGVGRVLRRFDRSARAWLKVQDGCDEHCTFCATTLARGANRSRDEMEILAEAEALAEHHVELVLTGVHIGTYGQDRRDGSSLGLLVERLVEQVPRVRFRLSSVEATEVDDRLAALMADAPERLAPHLHAPLQSGSDFLLKRMGRHWYTARSYRQAVERLTKRLSTCGLGADVMVGFPGERTEDHAATMGLVADLPFTYLHVFPYSERPGAAAARLGPAAAPAAVKQRAAELRALAHEKGTAYRAARSGRRADVVLLSRAAAGPTGLTGDYLTVVVPPDPPPARRFAATLALDQGGALTALRE
jgi:threonylcarbamoyladenosine tRNA methylthiotransferase MtaB